tara:strand:- start:8041 stop:9033 length:993 start_codon:yes stop_codon:yes gene_type:complete
MATNFKYASQSDLKNYFNNFGDFDQKTQIYPTLTSGNLHLFRDCGYVDTFFVNGEELAAAQSTSGAVDSNGEWFYASATNQLEYYNSNYSSTTINEQIFETGVDFATFIDQQLVNASMELNNLLDARFQMPLPKSTQIKEGSASGLTPEYDPVIIKATCYLAAANLIRSKDPMSEEAQFYMDMITNAEGTGLVDKLNVGQIKLSFEIDNKDSQGSIREVTRSGSMYLVETEGEFFGGRNGYDLIRITCTTAGAYGTAKCKVEYYGNDKLFGSETTDNIVTGGLDDWGALGGLKVRFQGSSMSENDQWEIEVYSEHLEETNAVTRNISLHR